ncbi:MAG: hypothetical protein P4L53_18600 [Candidatus Obscuribacterales bacterium]|nr:hypothetical protein [Candidatus Obscuribacterales bacterium]
MSESESPNLDESSAEVAASSSAAKETERTPRRAGFANFFRAMHHIRKASAAENVEQRFSDYLSIALVLICIVSLVFAVSMPAPPTYKLLPLFLTVGAVVFYIVNRLGIIISLTSRQALIVWQILIAGFWLGVTSAMLVMFACIYFVSQGANGF